MGRVCAGVSCDGGGAQVLVSALGQVLGAVAAEGCIRPPADVAVVEAAVRLSGPSQVALPAPAAAPPARCSCSPGAVELVRQSLQE